MSNDFDTAQAIKELARAAIDNDLVRHGVEALVHIANGINRHAIAHERLAEAHERHAAAMESIAAQLPALIEASKSRGYGGGGNWKKGTERGIFKTTPKVATFEPNDTFKVPVDTYTFSESAQSLTFFGLFYENGELADDGKGAKVGTLKLESKTYKDAFASWPHKKDNVRHVLGSPFFLVFKVAKGKDDKPNFAYVSGKEKFPDNFADAGAITYAELPEPPAKAT